MRFLAFLAAFAFPAFLFSQELGPEALVKQVTSDVLEAIKSDRQLAAGDREKALKLAEEKILPHVDFQEAARLAVGRSWSQASPEQQKQLVDAFRTMLVRTYSSALGTYQGQTMKVMPVRMKPGDTEVTVSNQYSRPGGRPVQIDYQMHRTPQGWKIYDIVAEGVSLVITYRSEFDAIVRQDGLEGLIKRLSQRNSPAAGAGASASAPR